MVEAPLSSWLHLSDLENSELASLPSFSVPWMEVVEGGLSEAKPHPVNHDGSSFVEL